MSVREAQVRDHDELLQIIAKSQLRCPALAQVSSRDDRHADYALAHLIRQQTPEDKVLVAQSAGQLVGCMAVTRMVDISPLQQNFDLQVYDQLVQPEVYEAALAAYSQRVSGPAAGAKSDAPMADVTESNVQTTQVDGQSRGLQGAEKCRQLLTAVFQDLQQADTVPNAFAMTMLCCDPESQQKTASLTLLAAAFDAFPDKDYCLLTLPPDCPEVPLLASFTRLLPPPGSVLAEVLYLCHRFALLDDFQVQLGTKAHVEDVQELLVGVTDMAATQAAFTAGVEANSAYVVCCQGQVIGMTTAQQFTDLSQLQHDFQTTCVPGLTADSAADKRIMQLTFFCLNPIFAHRGEQVLQEVLKRCKSRLLLYLLQPDCPAPEVLKVFRQVAPRHRLQTMPKAEAAFALFAFCCEAPSRTPVNSHVVVAGASSCGLSVVESLLLHEKLSFNAITLLAPGGIAKDEAYNAKLLSRLGLHASVNVLDAELVSIDRKRQCITLSDKSKVQYGVLVLAMGLQSPTVLSGQPRLDMPQVISLQGMPGNVPEGINQMDSIIVHGPALEAYTAIGHLQAAGVDLAKVKHLAPARQQPGPAGLYLEGLSVLLQEAAGLAGVALLAATQVADISVQSAEDSKVLVTATRSNGQLIMKEADLLVLAAPCCETPDSIVQAARGCDLVCDGRLVVDAAFKTNDPKVFCAGTIARFSRRYGQRLCPSWYNSQEVGQRAADSIAATFSSPFLGDSALPQLRCSRLVTTALPGGVLFAYACAAGVQVASSTDYQNGRSLMSNNQHGYCQLRLDTSNVIQSAVLCSARQEPSMPPELLLPLVGLPVTYLHELLHSYETGKVPDVPQYLRQPWTGLLYHDHFPQLRSSLMHHLVATGRPLQELDGNSIGANDEAAVARIQNDVVDFLKQQGAAELPQYQVSAYIS